MAQRFKPGSITSAELRALSAALRQRSPAAAHRHSALLQLAEGAAAAAEGAHAECWEAVQREERQLLFACTESGDAAASHLAELCGLLASGDGSGGSAAPPLTLSDVCLLTLAAYCQLPDFLPW